MLNKKALVLLLVWTLVMVHSASNAAEPEFTIDIKDHLFYPATLEILAGQKVKLLINNLDPTPEEFESYSLNREKVIPGNSSTIIFIGPLKQGEYVFFGEYYSKTAQGKVIVR